MGRFVREVWILVYLCLLSTSLGSWKTRVASAPEHEVGVCRVGWPPWLLSSCKDGMDEVLEVEYKENTDGERDGDFDIRWLALDWRDQCSVSGCRDATAGSLRIEEKTSSEVAFVMPTHSEVGLNKISSEDKCDCTEIWKYALDYVCSEDQIVLKETRSGKWKMGMRDVVALVRAKWLRWDATCGLGLEPGGEHRSDCDSKLRRLASAVDTLWVEASAKIVSSGNGSMRTTAVKDWSVSNRDLCWLFADINDGIGCPDVVIGGDVKDVEPELDSFRNSILGSSNRCSAFYHLLHSQDTSNSYFYEMPHCPMAKPVDGRSIFLYYSESNLPETSSPLMHRAQMQPIRQHKKNSGKKGRKSRRDSTKRSTPHVDLKKLNHRVNFASDDLGARILGFNEGTIGANNVLRHDSDRYMLAPCKEKLRFVVIELSEEIVVEAVEIVNREYYSSSPEKVMLLSSGRYPTETWQKLGLFEFPRGHEVQTLALERPTVARYLKVVFVGSHDAAYYCTITEVRVLGKTLIDDWKDAIDNEYRGDATVKPVEERGDSNKGLLRKGNDEALAAVMAVGEDFSGVSGYDNIFRRLTRTILSLQYNQTRLEKDLEVEFDRMSRDVRTSRYESTMSRREVQAMSELAWSANNRMLKEVELARKQASWAVGLAAFSLLLLVLTLLWVLKQSANASMAYQLQQLAELKAEKQERESKIQEAQQRQNMMPLKTSPQVQGKRKSNRRNGRNTNFEPSFQGRMSDTLRKRSDSANDLMARPPLDRQPKPLTTTTGRTKSLTLQAFSKAKRSWSGQSMKA